MPFWEDELRSCPHCGGTEISVDGPSSMRTVSWRVSCHGCGLSGPHGEKLREAVDAWNGLPRRLVWTTEKPSSDGFYWRHQKPGFGTVVEFVESGIPVRDGDEWAGPIPYPTHSSPSGKPDSGIMVPSRKTDDEIVSSRGGTVFDDIEYSDLIPEWEQDKRRADAESVVSILHSEGEMITEGEIGKIASYIRGELDIDKEKFQAAILLQLIRDGLPTYV